MLKKLSHFTRRLIVDEDGPTSVEYAVMIMLILLACIATIQVIGQTSADSFTDSSTRIEESFNL